MEELKQLNNLCGELEIRNMEDVGNEEEAASAHLELKRFLTCLSLRYSDNRKPNQSAVSEVILQAFRPHLVLRLLRIYGYPGFKLPTWLGFSSFSGLHLLSLRNCIGCHTLPALGNLPELRSLAINGMPTVRRLTTDLFGSMHGFTKRDSLEFHNLEEWEEWEPLVADERIFTFPCLRKFRISYCPNLRSLPPILGGSLQDVHIGRSMDLDDWELSFLINNVESLSCGSAECLNRLPSLPLLQSLSIEGDDVVSELSNCLLKFSSLQTLNIRDCKNLKSLPEEMGSLKQQRELHMYNCPLLE